MAQQNDQYIGGPVGRGDDGGPLTSSCTYYYSPGPGNVIPGPQVIDVVPYNYQNQGYSTTQAVLRVHSSSGPSSSADVMCASYYLATKWNIIDVSLGLYQKGCCIAIWYPGDNKGTNPNTGGSTGGGTGGSTGGGTGGSTGGADVFSCQKLFGTFPYNSIDYWENPSDTIINSTYPNGAPLSNIRINVDYDLTLDGGGTLNDIEPCCTEQNIGFPVKWLDTPYDEFNTDPNITPEDNTLLRGRCVSLNNCTTKIDKNLLVFNDGKNNSNGGISALINGTSTFVPTDNAIYYIASPVIGLPIAQVISENCCKNYILSNLGYSVSWDSNLKKCMYVPDPCTTPNTVILDTVNNTITNITRQDCCTVENTGNNSVYWDNSLKKCKYTTLPDTTKPCPYDSYKVGPYLTTTQNLTSQNIQQLFGYSNGNLIPVSKDCCSLNNTGYNVSWNSDLNICQFGTSTTNSVDLVLNEEPISIDGCDQVLVSVKMYFAEPDKTCLTQDDSISVSLLPNNPNITVNQIDIFDSTTDGFNNWVNLSASFYSASGGTFNLNLHINGGIVKCCDYDIRVDDIRVDCYTEKERVYFDTKKCVGFDLARVIDNKKSWVYNPGLEDIGSAQDNLIRERGEEGLIQGYGNINRTFAPSDDADIPWRYTDYYEQSNVLEPHSRAVMNSKEMELTFNMCSECCSTYSKCPKDYTLISLSGGTEYCSKTTVYCPNGYTLSAGTCYSGVTTASTLSETLTGETGSYCSSITNLLQLEEYKKVFQSFWVRMIEQFVPATTIFISGEKWCNNDNFICTEFNECDYDFEYVDSEITVIEYSTSDIPKSGSTVLNGGNLGQYLNPAFNMSGGSQSQINRQSSGQITINGFNITPVEIDPTGGKGIVFEREIVQPFDRPFDLAKERYYRSIIKGGLKEIFE